MAYIRTSPSNMYAYLNGAFFISRFQGKLVLPNLKEDKNSKQSDIKH